MIWTTRIRNHPRFGPWAAQIERRPGWVIRAAILAAVFVVVVPLLLLTLAAVVVGAVVLVVGSLVARLLALFGSPPREPSLRDQGRENVRVLRR